MCDGKNDNKKKYKSSRVKKLKTIIEFREQKTEIVKTIIEFRKQETGKLQENTN